MLLTSIQIQGFKSFADKTVLKFGRGVTAVVGPNGSGKSNISDAVRWVLGEQSTKSLRGQSMEDVIFDGTSDRRPHGFCEVTLNIDNADRELNFDNDFVSVTRRYYRSHDSEYLINGNVVRLRDIHELFMDTGLGRDGYSMIGQGKIDSIISTKSQERRDIFEEASGISRYRYRKLDAERKLSAADDNLVRLLDIMKELEDRIAPLSEQSRKAELFLELARQKKDLEIGLWIDLLNNSKERLKTQEDKITTVQSHYKEVEGKLIGFDEQNDKNSADFARFTSEIEDRRQRISEYNENIARLVGEISVLNNDILHNNQSIERLNGEIDEISGSKDRELNEITAKEQAVAEKTIKIESLNTLLAETEKELSELILSSESVSRKIEDYIISLNNISAKSADAKVEVMSAASSTQEIELRKASIDTMLAKHNEEINGLLAEYNETVKLLDKIEEEIVSRQNSLNGYALRLKTRKETADNLKASLDELHLDIESKKRKIQLLEDLEKNMDGFSHPVKTVMKQSSEGKLRGVYGPVSRLISVNNEYSVAIETALGTAAQNIIVDTEATAKYAIEMLKRSNSGRATFLPVSSVKAKEFKDGGFEDEFGYVDIASNLVGCDAKFKEIINHLLSGTVVVENIDSAISIAKKFKYRFKIVTLDGQVVNMGGSITGGSLVKNAGLLSRTKEIENLKAELLRLSGTESDKQKQYDTALIDLSAIEGSIKSEEDLLKTAGEDKIRSLAELKRVEELKVSTENLINSLKAEMATADEKIAAIKNAAEAAEKELICLEAEKESLNRHIAEMTDGREELGTKREELTTKITEIKLLIIEIQKDIEALNVSITLLATADLNRNETIEALNAEILSYGSNNEQINLNIAEINQTIETLKKATVDFEGDIATFIERRNQIEQRSAMLRSEEKELSLEKEKLGGELVRLSERRENMIKECEDVLKQLFDEYQLTKSEAEALQIKIENHADAKKNLSEIKSKIRSLGNVNVSAIEEFKEVNERYTFMKEQIDDLEKSRSELRKLISQLTEQMKELFIVGFNKIGENFSKTFSDLFGGGSAKLVLTDPNNILESGIDIVAKLPGKNVPSLDGLSGGEKALVALAIYFAIMKVNAPPFCFLDEVDTALDDINVDRFADYMVKSNFKTQFICITHKRGTMESADMLYGVTMQEKGVSKLLELNVAELEKQLKLENRR